MKNSKIVIITLLVFGFCFSNNLSAQKFQKQKAKRTVIATDNQKNDVKIISASKLKNGSNYLRVGATKVEIIKSRGRVISLRPISNSGKKGSNMFANRGQKQEFTCIGDLCVCFGDDDCNDMFTSNVCSSSTRDAVCVGDDCVCVVGK